MQSTGRLLIPRAPPRPAVHLRPAGSPGGAQCCPPRVSPEGEALRAPGAAEAGPRHAVAPSWTVSEHRGCAPVRVLVADDEDDIRALVASRSRKAGRHRRRARSPTAPPRSPPPARNARPRRPRRLDARGHRPRGVRRAARRPADRRHPHPAALRRRLRSRTSPAAWPPAPTPTWPSRSRRRARAAGARAHGEAAGMTAVRASTAAPRAARAPAPGAPASPPPWTARCRPPRCSGRRRCCWRAGAAARSSTASWCSPAWPRRSSAALVSRLVGRPGRPRRLAVCRPAGPPAAPSALLVGRAPPPPPSSFLLARRRCSRWSPLPGRRGVLLAALGTAAVLLRARSCYRRWPLPRRAAAAAAGARSSWASAGSAVNETTRRIGGRRPDRPARGRARPPCSPRCRPAPRSSTSPPACSPPARRP